jgi:hypothetical protein
VTPAWRAARRQALESPPRIDHRGPAPADEDPERSVGASAIPRVAVDESPQIDGSARRRSGRALRPNARPEDEGWAVSLELCRGEANEPAAYHQPWEQLARESFPPDVAAHADGCEYSVFEDPN